jgi:hypothetical protein
MTANIAIPRIAQAIGPLACLFKHVPFILRILILDE